MVVLNGPSSAGKTTLAMALREARSPRAAVVSVDQFFACVAPQHPDNWRLFAALTEATFAAAASFAKSGFDVVVDTVFERADCLVMATSALAGLRYHLVGVTCALEVLEARERLRGDRRPGQARDQHVRVLENAPHELTLDTGVLSVADSVVRVVALLANE